MAGMDTDHSEGQHQHRAAQLGQHRPVLTTGRPVVVLLGDAGHAVTPNLGQGCNSSLEDVGIFHTVILASSLPGYCVLPALIKAHVCHLRFAGVLWPPYQDICCGRPKRHPE